MSLHNFLFPKPDEQEIKRMRKEYHMSGQNLYSFMELKFLNSQPYIDCYVWDRNLPEEYMRFVVSDDFYWTTEEDKIFKYYVDQNPEVSGYDHHILYDELMREYPDLNLKSFPYKPLKTVLEVYYCLHPLCLEECLMKSSLDVIAEKLHQIEDIEREGRSPSEILGLPMKLLRMCNSEDAVEYLLSSKEKRARLKQVYCTYQHLFSEHRELSYGQCRYIESLIKKETEFTPDGHRILEFLKECDTSYSFNEYMHFLNYRKIMKQLKINIPLERNRAAIFEASEKSEYVLDALAREEEINEKLERIYNMRAQELEMDCMGEKYAMVMPKEIAHVFDGCEQLENCLYKYVEQLENERCYILFIVDRETEKIEGAVEIVRPLLYIRQALGRKNLELNKELRYFLETYSKEKNIAIHEIYEYE